MIYSSSPSCIHIVDTFLAMYPFTNAAMMNVTTEVAKLGRSIFGAVTMITFTITSRMNRTNP